MKKRHQRGATSRLIEKLEPRQLLALTIANLPATDVTANAATVGVEILDTSDSNPTISIYWGDEDGGTNLRDWDQVENLGVRPIGQHAIELTDLTAGTEYFFRSFAFTLSDGGQLWADETTSFMTDPLPTAVVNLRPNSVVGDSSAIVRGTVDGLGTLESVALYFGSIDAGTNAGAWERSLDLETADGPFSATLTNLAPNTPYFVRLAAANGGGTAWTEPQSMTTADVAPLRISEVMTANASTLPTRIRLNAEDRFAGPTNSHDWFEIQNSTATDQDLSGFYASDDVRQPAKWQLPPGTTVKAHSSLMIFASSSNVTDPALDEQGILHTNFSLSRESLYLSLADRNGTVVHELDDENLNSTSDVSFGFFGNQFGTLATPSPGESNGTIAPSIELPSHEFESQEVSSPLVVSTKIVPAESSVSEVRLIYRSMFNDEQTISMLDDGQGADQLAGDQIYTATIPGATAQPGEILRYAVSVTDANDITARMPRFLTDDNSPEYFGTMIADAAVESRIPVLHRFIEDARRAETGSGTRASVFYDGEFYDNVFIRIRGGTARSWPKKAYKIEFNDDYDFRFDPNMPRVDEFNLNTTYTDKSYVRAVLSYELYRDSGGIAPITFPMRVEQNGEFWNVAHFVEQPDRDYLRHNGLDPNGALYKARADRLNGLVNRAEGFFDKKTRHAEDASDLQGLIDGLALTGDELEAYLFDHVDLPAQINLMASNLILQNLDATDKNYYIYRDTEGNQEWKMLPWDLDLVLGPNALNTDSFSTSDDNAPAHTSHPYMGTLKYPFHGRKNHLFDAIVNSPRTNEMFLRRVRSMMDEFLTAADTPVEQRYFENRIDELVAVLGPDVLLDKETWGRQSSFGGRAYTLEEAAERIKDDYLVPRREHLYGTHHISQLETGEIKVLIPEFAENAEYFVPADNSLEDSWTGRSAPANSDQWQTGQLGIGFEDRPADYEQLIKTRVKPLETCDTCTNVMVRMPFSLSEPTAIENLTLRMKYDDGFVAYINGVEVTRTNTIGDVVEFDSRARSHADRLAVDFVNFDLSSSLADIDLQNENVLAVRIINSSATSNDMLVSFELVDGVVPNTNAVGIPRGQNANPAVRFQSFDQNPVSGNQDEEYLELHNAADEAIDISGWELRGGVTHRFQGGTVIPAGESLFVTPDSLAFRNRTTGPTGGTRLFVQDGIEGHLSNRSETIELVHGETVVASLTTPEIATDAQNFLRVTELHYNPIMAAEATEFIELRNISSDTTLDLNGVRLTDGPSEPFAFSDSQVTTLAPGAFVLIVNDANAFTEAYPSVDTNMIAGEFQGALSNGGETIKVEDAGNGTVLEFRYEDGREADEGSWHPSTDGDGFSLVIVNQLLPVESWSDGENWRPSSQVGGSPGSADGTPLDADFDNDGDIDVDDLDLLSAAVRQADLAFDLNQDGTTDMQDRTLMVESVFRTGPGDANLDGVFNSADLVLIFEAGEYEDGEVGNSGWAEGDWDGDGDFSSSDLVAAFASGNYVRAAVMSQLASVSKYAREKRGWS